MNDMANETTPIYDALLGSVGNPIPVPAIDRSYEAIMKLAAASPASAAEPEALAAVPAPAKERRMATAARKSGS